MNTRLQLKDVLVATAPLEKMVKLYPPWSLSYLCWIDSRNLEVTGKVSCVEREDVSETIHKHHRYKSGIMNIDAHNGVGSHKPFSLWIDRRSIEQERKEPLEVINLHLSFHRCMP